MMLMVRLVRVPPPLALVLFILFRLFGSMREQCHCNWMGQKHQLLVSRRLPASSCSFHGRSLLWRSISSQVQNTSLLIICTQSRCLFRHGFDKNPLWSQRTFIESRGILWLLLAICSIGFQEHVGAQLPSTLPILHRQGTTSERKPCCVPSSVTQSELGPEAWN